MMRADSFGILIFSIRLKYNKVICSKFMIVFMNMIKSPVVLDCCAMNKLFLDCFLDCFPSFMRSFLIVFPL